MTEQRPGTRNLALMMEDLEFQAAIVRDVTNESRIANAFGDLQTAYAAMSLLQHRVTDVQALWEVIMREYDSLGITSSDVSLDADDTSPRSDRFLDIVRKYERLGITTVGVSHDAIEQPPGLDSLTAPPPDEEHT